MRKTLSLLGILVLTLCAAVVVAAPHHTPEEVTIDAAQDKKPAVTFPHMQHATELVDNCTACHHKNEGLTMETDAEVQPCSTCHLDPEGDTPGMREMSLRKNPFHMLCIDCHKDEGAGPKTCNDCHVK
ncbi:MAG: cytochrome c3 family protein [Acidobacteriota bacterium]|jgi:hypothetical protein